jgi:hypothetical protein
MVASSNAQAAADNTGPRLTVPIVASFIVGQSVSDPYDLEGNGDLSFMTDGATMEYKWTATDSSGICRYAIDEEHTSEGWHQGTVDYQTNATAGQFTYRADEYYNSDDLSRIRFNAYDCVGNRTSVERSPSYIHMAKDYGPNVPGGWGRTSCTCAMGDSMLRTSTYGASLSTVVNAGGINSRFALIMAKGPARGKAAIYYDGRYIKTIDTYAASNTNRIVMWDTTVTGSRNHTIKVVNLATSGRPRIDIDAYVESSFS